MLTELVPVRVCVFVFVSVHLFVQLLSVPSKFVHPGLDIILLISASSLLIEFHG